MIYTHLIIKSYKAKVFRSVQHFSSKKISKPLIYKGLLKKIIMPATGIEPVREYKSRRILSPVRLPVPPRRHKHDNHVQWMEVDSNHRSNMQQIYSLSPLATRESIHVWCKEITSHQQLNIISKRSTKCKKNLLYLHNLFSSTLPSKLSLKSLVKSETAGYSLPCRTSDLINMNPPW